ncbi:MAG: right-handed parallel beta-helix repeat-containing protein [Candidatus Woesearchaeota archaeon]|nr:MAG: right-handed parallel beta-helix repeat-containing protein [Candidatus Woesearchaeota archaeon]
MKKGIVSIASIVLLIVIMLVAATSFQLIYNKMQLQSQTESQASAQQLAGNLVSKVEVLSDEYFIDVTDSQDAITLDIKNVGGKTLNLDVSHISLTVENTLGDVICESDSLDLGGTFETDITRLELSPTDMTRFNILINKSLCQLKIATDYKYILLFPQGIYTSKKIYTIPSSGTPPIPMPPNVIYCIDCDNCSTEIQSANAGDTVYLITDTPPEHDETCINFNGTDGITFDCQGYTIDGNTAGFDAGILLPTMGDGSNNNIIKNCNIKEFGIGIYVSGSKYNTIENTVANSNAEIGVYLSYSNFTTVKNNTLNFNKRGAYNLGGGSNMIIDSNMSSNTEYDFDMFAYADVACDVYLENVTGSGGNPIGYYNYTVNLQDRDLAALILCDADNSVIDNVTIVPHPTIKNNGLSLQRTESTSIIGVNSSDNSYGIRLSISNYNNISNTITNSNSNDGIYLYQSDYNNITDITSISNSGDGVGLSSADYNIVDRAVAYLNDAGITIGGSEYNIVKNMNSSSSTGARCIHLGFGANFNTLSNIIANGNKNYGLYISQAEHNNLTNITSNSHSNYGVLLSNSHYNTLTQIRTHSNNFNGFRIYSSHSNKIYDCLFNNTNNVGFGFDIYENYWNTAKQAGTNIIGGNWIGGNFWTTPSGNDYSDNCIDLSPDDGICDYPYDVYDDDGCNSGLNTETVESNDDIGKDSGIAIDSNGVIHISHQNETTDDLRYCNGTFGNWDCEDVETTGVVGAYSSIAIDSTNVVHMAHYNNTGEDLRYCNGTFGNWDCENVETTGDVGSNPSIAIDSNNIVHIAHQNYSGFSPDELRHCNGTFGNWDCKNVETGVDIGYYSSIAIDQYDNVHISHYNANGDDLRYCNNSGGTWSCDNVETAGDVGTYSSIAIDSTNVVHIVHYNKTGDDLRYCNNSGGSWNCENVETTGNIGKWPSIAIDSTNVVHISHYDYTNADLRYCNNSVGSWSCIKLEGADSNELGYPTGRNLAVKKGRLVDSTSDSDISISWYNDTDLMYTSFLLSCSENTDYWPLTY